MRPADASAEKLVGLQILRALAALSIAIHHVQHEAGLLAAATGRVFQRSEILPWTAGIDVFFVISGFIMVHSSARLFGRPGGRRIFLARRLARIVPLYWLASTALLAIALARPGVLNQPPGDLAYLAASYLFIPAMRSDGLIVPFYSLGWTLNYEMLFYAVFALALPLRRGQAVMIVMAILVAAVVLGRLAAPLPTALAFWSAPIVAEFAVGMVLGLAHAQGWRLPLPARLALCLGGIAGLWAGAGLDAEFGIERVALFGTCGAMLLAAAAFGGRDRAGAAARWASRLGDASYALYLLHPFATRGVRFVLQGAGADVPPAALIPIGLVAAIAAALAAHAWLERPLIAIVRARLDPTARPAKAGFNTTGRTR